MIRARNRKGERGAALILAIIVIFILTVLGLALLFTTTTEVQVAGAETTLNKVFYAADSGTQYGIYQIKTKPPPPTPDSYQACTSNSSYFCFSVPERSTASSDRSLSVQVTSMKVVNQENSDPGACNLNINSSQSCLTYEYSFTASASSYLPNSTTVSSTKSISVVTAVGPIVGAPL
jgi:Tfp pilus assembly protein PilX